MLIKKKNMHFSIKPYNIIKIIFKKILLTKIYILIVKLIKIVMKIIQKNILILKIIQIVMKIRQKIKLKHNKKKIILFIDTEE